MASRGDRVLAWWPGEREWWYAGVVCEVGAEIEVQYDDCNRASLTPEQVRPLAIGVGSRVYVRWRGDVIYYPGRISEVVGSAFHVAYDDGDTEWASLSAMRVHEKDL